MKSEKKKFDKLFMFALLTFVAYACVYLCVLVWDMCSIRTLDDSALVNSDLIFFGPSHFEP